MLLLCAGTSESAELVSVAVIVGKRAEFKKMPNAVMLQLESRAARDVSSEKREHDMRPRLEQFE